MSSSTLPIAFTTYVQKLQDRRHVRLAVRPIVYDREAIPSNASLLELVEKSCVSIRGWNLPHIGRRGTQYPEDRLLAYTYDGDYAEEAWVAFKSGQFLFAELCSEEDEEVQKRLANDWSRFPREASFFLSWPNVIFSFCEYFEFARRWMLNGDWQDGIIVEIRFFNMDGVSLASTDGKRATGNVTPSIEKIITIRRSLSFGDLASTSTKASRSALMAFFGAFRYGIREDIVKSLQEEFFSLRLGHDRDLPEVD